MNVGMQLREAREARGLSLAAVASSTRIKVGVLEGLERNDLSALPPRPYARGFVAAYAREVGLDAEQTVRKYFAHVADVAEAPPLPRPWIAVEEPAGPRLWVPAIALILVAAAVGLIMIKRSAAPAPTELDIVGTSGTIAAARPTASARLVAADSIPRVGARGDAAPAIPASNGQVVVTLQLERPSWVAATADGRRVIYRVLPSGDTQTVRASRDIVLRVGDAGAVRWSINGRPAVPMGAFGEVRNVRVTANDQR
jgi:hypothetical protein